MPELTDAQLDQLIADLGLREPRQPRPLAPCGTPAAYTRHIKRGEPVDDACRQANTEHKRTKGTPTAAKRKPIAHGEPRGAKQHRYRGEKPCEPCRLAETAYQRERYTARAHPEAFATDGEPRLYLTEAEWQERTAGGAR